MFTSADAYDRFMGRYSQHLAAQMADLGHVAAGTHVLDVGCGTGILTAELVRRTGAANVAAIDPSEQFVDAVRARYPGVDVRVGGAEALPFADATFDAALAQLVVHFMSDPVGGIREMARVTRPGGAVAACVWDNGAQGPMTLFWRAVSEIDPTREGEGRRAGEREGHLAEIFIKAGLHAVEPSALMVRLEQPSFEAWWGPQEFGVGPVGAYLKSVDPDKRAAIKERCRTLMPSGAFTHEVRAWAARGTV